MIDWSSGYSSKFELLKIDPGTWMPTNDVHGLYTASVNRDATDDTPLLETASITVDGNAEDGWYRLILRARQDGIEGVDPLGTFRFSANTTSYFGSARKSMTMDGVSVLHPCSTVKCRVGEYAGKGESVGEWVLRALRDRTPAPVRIGTDVRKAISDWYVFDDGTKVIKSVWDVLDAAEWVLQIDGYGVITILPKPDVPKFEIGKSNYGILQPQFDRTTDRNSAPNVYRITKDDKEIEVINDDPNSEISVSRRGYRIEETENNPMLLDGESRENYGKRKLTEMSKGFDTWKYDREYIPGITVFDMVDCRRQDIGMVGKATIMSQKLTCDKGVKIDEKVAIEVSDYACEYVELDAD